MYTFVADLATQWPGTPSTLRCAPHVIRLVLVAELCIAEASTVGPLIFDALSDTLAVNHRVLWDMVLKVLKGECTAALSHSCFTQFRLSLYLGGPAAASR